MKKTKRNKITSRDFLISASVTSLTIECQKDPQWHPNKLLILWGKENTTCQTKPVLWQPEITNPYCGIHVWNEPDSVKIISTLYKNTNRGGTYEEKPWKIIVKNECTSGRHEVIARGCVDIADYISETYKTYELAVTLTPAKKNVFSALIEFSFTSVMIQDGIQLPHPSKKELKREILKHAIESAKYAKAKAVNTTSPKGKGTVPVPPSSVDKALPSRNPSEAEESIAQAGALNTPGATTSNSGGGSNNGWAKKGKRKRRPPPRPSVSPNCLNTAVLATMATPVKNKWNMKDMKPSSVQGESEDNGLDNAVFSHSAGRKQKEKRKSKIRDPVPSSSSKRSLSSDGAQVCEEGTTKDPGHREGEENGSCAEVPSLKGRQKNWRKNGKRHSSGGRSSDGEAATSSSREEHRKGSEHPKDESSLGTEETCTREESSGANIPEQGFGTHIGTGDDTGQKEQTESDETSDSKMKDADYRGFEQLEDTALGTQAENSLEKTSAGDKVEIKRQRLATLAYYEKLLQGGPNMGPKKDAPEKPALQASGPHTEIKDVTENKEQEDKRKTSNSKTKDADHCGSEQHKSAASENGAENSLEQTPAGEQSKTEETDSAEKEKQRLATLAFYEKLLQRSPNKGLKKNAPQKPTRKASLTHTATEDVTESREQEESGKTSTLKTKDAGHRGSEQHASRSHDKNSLEKTPAEEQSKTQETDSVFAEKEKQRLASFWEKLLQKDPKKAPGIHESSNRQKTPAGEMSKTEETDSVAAEKEKQRLASFYQKLLQKGPKKVSKHCPDLSTYVAEEMKLLQAEIASLAKVTVKLEVEMRQVMGIKDCKEELDGLRQDWLTLTEHRKELKTRKRDLQILDKQEDLEQCCDILRTDIELLFKLEEWRKTDHHRSQEVRLLDLLLCLEDKRIENCRAE